MTNKEWLDYLAHNAPDELSAWFDAERITNQAEMLHMPESHGSANPDCSAMLYKTFTGNMCSNYEPKDGVVAILREAARNLSDYHDAGEALRRLTDTTNVYHALETLADMVECDYVRRESIEEVMDNDRALVEENSMLARELLKLRAELDAAKQQISQFDAPKSVETLENPASKCEISDFDDSRERLEADVFACLQQAYITYPKVIELLDRQAAITAEETSNAWEEYRDAAQREITELTAERDKLKELNEYHALQYELASEDADRLQAQVDRLTAEREQYRKLFGMALDWAHEITMLETSIDEGMA